MRGYGIMDKEYLPKEKAIYQAVLELFEEGADLNNLTVSEITKRAGIGKGTAYEYFSDKEEMIAKALFYNTEIYSGQLYEGMMKKKSLYHKIDYLLLTMEGQITNTNCIFRLMLLSDNSMLSRRMRELLEQKKASGEMPGIYFVRKVLEHEFEGEMLPSAEKMDYLVLSILSRILCFIMWLEKDAMKKPDETASMRKLLCEGICQEVARILGKDV